MPSYTHAIMRSVAAEPIAWALAGIVAMAVVIPFMQALDARAPREHQVSNYLGWFVIVSGPISFMLMAVVGIAGGFLGIPGYPQQAGPPYNMGLPVAAPTLPEAALDIAASWWAIEFAGIGITRVGLTLLRRVARNRSRE